MNYTIDNPKGIDVWIQRLQTELHDYLLQVWQLRDKDYQCFGRAYRNRSNTGYVPEMYYGNKEYRELLLDDKVKLLSFFGVSDVVRTDSYKSQTADVHLIFFVNLDAIRYTDAAGKQIRMSDRGAAEARLDVRSLLKLESHRMVNTGEVTGVEKVLAEYHGLRPENLIQFDQQPYHCFRFNMQCTYDPVTR